jgi:hypothetical protein
VLGDLYAMTFDSVTDAVWAWLDVRERIREFNAGPRGPFGIDFRAGVAVGDIRVFRAVLYGAAINRASLSCGHGAPDVLTTTAPLAAELPAEVLERLAVRAAAPRDEEHAAQARAIGLDDLVALVPRGATRATSQTPSV